MSLPLILATRAAFHFEGKLRLGINKAYGDAIRRSGGILMMLASGIDGKDAGALLERADGLLIPGGADVNPALYKEAKKEYTQPPDDERDIMELLLIEAAIEKRIPILAICRGMQVLNVKLGGALYQDIGKEKEGSLKHDRHKDGPRSMIAHEVLLKESSMIAKITESETLEVNSLHHQGVKALGKGLVAAGVSPDGLVEAIEMPEHPWLIGIQWHPEELFDAPAHKNLFDSFVKTCFSR